MPVTLCLPKHVLTLTISLQLAARLHSAKAVGAGLSGSWL
jgi:hypothetical protein